MDGDTSEIATPSRQRVLPAKYDGKAVFSVIEAGCEILGLSKSVAYAAVAAGQIPSLRIRGRILVPRAALEKLLTGGA
jgi:excisionase family DNA binding protein